MKLSANFSWAFLILITGFGTFGFGQGTCAAVLATYDMEIAGYKISYVEGRSTVGEAVQAATQRGNFKFENQIMRRYESCEGGFGAFAGVRGRRDNGIYSLHVVGGRDSQADADEAAMRSCETARIKEDNPFQLPCQIEGRWGSKKPDPEPVVPKIVMESAYAYFHVDVPVSRILIVKIFVAPQAFEHRSGAEYLFAPPEVQKQAESALNGYLAGISASPSVLAHSKRGIEVAHKGTIAEGDKAVKAEYDKFVQAWSSKRSTTTAVRVVVIDPQSGKAQEVTEIAKGRTPARNRTRRAN